MVLRMIPCTLVLSILYVANDPIDRAPSKIDRLNGWERLLSGLDESPRDNRRIKADNIANKTHELFTFVNTPRRVHRSVRSADGAR